MRHSAVLGEFPGKTPLPHISQCSGTLQATEAQRMTYQHTVQGSPGTSCFRTHSKTCKLFLFFHWWVITLDKFRWWESSRLIFCQWHFRLSVWNSSPLKKLLKNVMNWPLGLGSTVRVTPVNARGHHTQKNREWQDKKFIALNLA